jgi:hypothetical protein
MKPGDFLIGVLDFFAILLPGSLATWLATRYIPPSDLAALLSVGLDKAGPNPVVLWSAFLLSSYVLGHFVFMMGAALDPSYDRWRRRRKPSSSDSTFLAANGLRKKLTATLDPSDFTTLKWAKAYIQVAAQHARGEIDRLEADSKFFRSLVVVSVAIAAHFLVRERLVVAGGACLVLAVLARKRYVDQRWKMTELCYATAVIVAACRPAAGSDPPSAPSS